MVTRLSPQGRYAFGTNHSRAHFLIFVLRLKTISDACRGRGHPPPTPCISAPLLLRPSRVPHLRQYHNDCCCCHCSHHRSGGIFDIDSASFMVPRLHHRPPPTEVTVDQPSDMDSVGSFEPSSLDEALAATTDETMVEAMSRNAMDSSNERSKRDYKALVWTMKSLTENVELEPFVEAIPDFLWGPTYRRKTYEDHIKGLLSDSEVQLLGRIETLLKSCHAGILSSNASQCRVVTCCKALWAIAAL
ncbi:hypothetical protein B0H19DRAFT_1289619, partial [Mycena capillaripes]